MNPAARDSTIAAFQGPSKLIPNFLRHRVIDSRVCHENPKITYFAWMTNDQLIEVNTFDSRSRAPWMRSADCSDCFHNLRHTVQERGFDNQVFRPMKCSHEYVPPSAPFMGSELLETSRCQTAPILNYAWFRRDGKIGTSSYNFEEERWMDEMDKDSLERIKMSVRAKGYENEVVNVMVPKFILEVHPRMYHVPELPTQSPTVHPPLTPTIPMPDIECQEVQDDLPPTPEPEASSPKPDITHQAVQNTRSWVPTIQQIETLHEHLKTARCIRMSGDDQVKLVSNMACDMAWQNSRAYSEKELETMDFDPLWLDDDLEEWTAVRILLECATKFKEADSDEQKYEAMMRIAEEIVDEHFSGLKESSSDDEEEDASDEESTSNQDPVVGEAPEKFAMKDADVREAASPPPLAQILAHASAQAILQTMSHKSSPGLRK